MYGQSYYSRHSYLVNKALGPEKRHEMALKRWETIRDKQTPEEINEYEATPEDNHRPEVANKALRNRA